MEVRILQIDWLVEMPIATVTTTDRVFRISLLHQSFVQRHKLGIGSRLQLSATGFIHHVIEAVGEYTPPEPNTPTIFDKWFLFYQEVEPFLGKRIAQILFRNGIQTVTDIGRHRQLVDQLYGIGPVTTRIIGAMCTTLHLDPNDIVK